MEILFEAISKYLKFGKYLKCVVPSGLDLLSESRKLFFEIKNSNRSDNSSSRKAKERLLCETKKKYPDYTCIYGIVNKTSRKTIKIIDNVEILYLSGKELFLIIFGDNWEEIVEFVKLTYKKYRDQL